MSILNFVTQDQIDELSEDPQLVFMELVNHAQRKYDQLASSYNPREEYEWRELEDLKYSFMNIIVASAKKFRVEPFVSMEVPNRFNFKDEDHRQFRSDLDHYVTQLILENSSRSRIDSVAIPVKTKDKIRSYISGIRECIEKGNLSKDKKAGLLKRLDAFELEIDKRRVRLVEVAQFALALWAIPGASYSSYEVFNKLINGVMHAVAEAKDKEQEQRQLAPRTPLKALSPPRTEKASTTNYDLDEDIPF